MKKLSILFLASLFVCNAHSQIFYSFDSYFSSYIPIANGKNIILAQVNAYGTNPSPRTDDGYRNNIPIGFNFDFNGKSYSRIHACTNGFISFNPITPITKPLPYNYYLCVHDLMGLRPEDTAFRPIIAPFWADIDIQTSSVGGGMVYNTSGTAPNRVFTIEWANVLWDFGAYDGCMAFQVRLFETTNIIEFAYKRNTGAIIVSDSASFHRTYNEASIGITAKGLKFGNFISVQDTTGNPSVSFTNEAILTGRPLNNQVFRFKPYPPVLRDAAITKVFSTGQSSTTSGPQTVSAFITNLGSTTFFNLPVTLVVTGANNYSVIDNIDSLLPGETKDVKFNLYQPVNIGVDSFYVSLPPDDDSSNNNKSTFTAVSATQTSYASREKPASGFGQPTQPVDIAALFPNPNRLSVKNVSLKFAPNPSGPQQFKVSVYDATGLDKDSLSPAPGNLLWKSNILASIPDSEVVVKVVPNLKTTGNFFVVISQLSGTESLQLGYENENPLRNATFYYRTASTDGWIDLSTSIFPYIRPCVGVEWDKTIVLPVSFTKFSGLQLENNVNLLTWETKKETDSKLFEIHRSRNGKEFTAINTVKSKASSPTGTIGYSYSDHAPLEGINYYRLKQVDNNGAFSFSSVISIDNTKHLSNAIAEVYPNPVKNDLKVKFNSTRCTSASLSVTDATGRIVLSKKVSLQEGSNLITVNVADLKAGVYYIKSIDGNPKVSFIKE